LTDARKGEESPLTIAVTLERELRKRRATIQKRDSRHRGW